MELKSAVYTYYQQFIDSKIAALNKVLDDLRESGANETKSTAGDKHETALAMLQIEQANKRAQLGELLSQKAILNKIDPVRQAVAVSVGSLVKANGQYFFVSVALGKATVAGTAVIALSPQSPLGQAILGLKPGEKILFNKIEYLIEGIA